MQSKLATRVLVTCELSASISDDDTLELFRKTSIGQVLRGLFPTWLYSVFQPVATPN